MEHDLKMALSIRSGMSTKQLALILNVSNAQMANLESLLLDLFGRGELLQNLPSETWSLVPEDIKLYEDMDALLNRETHAISSITGF